MGFQTRSNVVRLAAVIVEPWEWQRSAACVDIDAELFFHPESERGPDSRHRDSQAKRVCLACPVRVECLDVALSVREPYGIWGGTSPEDRENMLVKR